MECLGIRYMSGPVIYTQTTYILLCIKESLRSTWLLYTCYKIKHNQKTWFLSSYRSISSLGIMLIRGHPWTSVYTVYSGCIYIATFYRAISRYTHHIKHGYVYTHDCRFHMHSTLKPSVLSFIYATQLA